MEQEPCCFAVCPESAQVQRRMVCVSDPFLLTGLHPTWGSNVHA